MISMLTALVAATAFILLLASIGFIQASPILSMPHLVEHAASPLRAKFYVEINLQSIGFDYDRLRNLFLCIEAASEDTSMEKCFRVQYAFTNVDIDLADFSDRFAGSIYLFELAKGGKYQILQEHICNLLEKLEFEWQIIHPYDGDRFSSADNGTIQSLLSMNKNSRLRNDESVLSVLIWLVDVADAEVHGQWNHGDQRVRKRWIRDLSLSLNPGEVHVVTSPQHEHICDEIFGVQRTCCVIDPVIGSPVGSFVDCAPLSVDIAILGTVGSALDAGAVAGSIHAQHNLLSTVKEKVVFLSDFDAKIVEGFMEPWPAYQRGQTLVTGSGGNGSTSPDIPFQTVLSFDVSHSGNRRPCRTDRGRVAEEHVSMEAAEGTESSEQSTYDECACSCECERAGADEPIEEYMNEDRRAGCTGRDTAARGDSQRASNASRTRQRYPSSPFAMPSTATFRIRYGHHEAHLQNVCMLNRTTIIMYAASPGKLLTPKLQRLLNKSFSGFKSPDLSKTGWGFVETVFSGEEPVYSSTGGLRGDTHGDTHSKTPSDGHDGPYFHSHESTTGYPKVTMFPGFTAAASPPYTPSIFHAAQCLMTLIFAAEEYVEQMEGRQAAEVGEERPFTDAHFDPSWPSKLSRILLPTIPKLDLPWTKAFARVASVYLRLRARDTDYFTFRNAKKFPQNLDDSNMEFYLLEDVESLFRKHTSSNREHKSIERKLKKSASCACPCAHTDTSEDAGQDHDTYFDAHGGTSAEDESLVCFDYLVVLGALTLQAPFVPSKASADLFREVAYWYTGLDTLTNSLSLSPNGKVSAESIEEKAKPPAHLNEPLVITIVLRPSNRWLRNLSEILKMIQRTGLVGEAAFHEGGEGAQYDHIPIVVDDIRLREDFRTPFRSACQHGHRRGGSMHQQGEDGEKLEDFCADFGPRNESESTANPYLRVVHLEWMSFVEQVRLFESTDVLIAPHGAALQNLVFMRPHSSVIEIMTSPWYEPGYQPTALLFDLHYFALPQTDLDRVSDCAFYNECTGAGEADPLGQYALLIERRSLHCYGMRTCACVVDVHALEVVLWQASQAVRLLKRDIHAHRRECASISGKDFNDFGRNPNDDRDDNGDDGRSYDCHHANCNDGEAYEPKRLCFYEKAYVPGKPLGTSYQMKDLEDLH